MINSIVIERSWLKPLIWDMLKQDSPLNWDMRELRDSRIIDSIEAGSCIVVCVEFAC